MRAFRLPLACCLALAACAPSTPPAAPPSDGSARPASPTIAGDALVPRAELDADAYRDLTGRLTIDGSSTVFPITEAIVQLFETLAPEVSVRLGVSGTGGGFAKFCRGQTDLQNASRPIKPDESRLCAEHGVRFVELPVAFDGISVVVHGENTWARCLTTVELRRLWRPAAASRLVRWSQLRSDFPDRPIHLYAPGRDSGTFDYFTRAIIGEEGSSRDDFTGSEDDYLLAQDIAADPDGLGFFGYAYYREYREVLRSVAVDPGSGCVGPDTTTITSGTYRPLSRPIFVYVSIGALDQPALGRFVELYLREAPRRVGEVGYVPLPERAYDLARRRLEQRRAGSLFDGGSQVGLSIETLLGMEAGDITGGDSADPAAPES